MCISKSFNLPLEKIQKKSISVIMLRRSVLSVKCFFYNYHPKENSDNQSNRKSAINIIIRMINIVRERVREKALM